jgi:hypothetical protein
MFMVTETEVSIPLPGVGILWHDVIIKDVKYEGFFYFDNCQSDLKFSSQDSFPMHPVGAVQLEAGSQEFQAWNLEPYAETMSLKIDDGSTFSTKLLLENIPADDVTIHYSHQYGVGGSELSPLFYSDTQSSFFIEPLPDAILLPTKDSLSITTGGRRLRSSNTLRNPIQLESQVSNVNFNHYQGIVSEEVVLGRSPSQIDILDLAQPSRDLADILNSQTLPAPVPNEATLPTAFRYRFSRFYHPYTCLFLKQLFQQGIDGLLNPDPTLNEDSEQLHRQLMPSETFSFDTTYQPTEQVYSPYPKHEIDFSHDSPYGSYNWELFFHIPLRIATSLMENQRFADARQWFHYIFDPTHANSNEPAPACFWKIRPFYEAQLASPSDTLQDLTDLLTQGNSDFEQQVQVWEAQPFQPHAIARLRIEAYMKYTVMQYLDCLMGEADLLFRQYSREALTEAKQLYVLAAKILGDQPVQLPAQETTDYTANLLLGRFNFQGVDLIESLASLLSPELPE